MTVIARLMRNRFDQRVAAFGVTRSQWALIVIVARNPGLSQRLIAEALEMTEAAAGRLIERLCADGLLERRIDSGDKRARCITLTDAAQPLLDKLSDTGLLVEDESFAGLSDGELEQMQALVGKIHANLAEAKPKNCR